jgi:tetratricopeptide (TPR) repeat protein
MRAGSNSALERQLRLDVYGHLEAVDLFKEVFQEIQKNEEDQPEQHALYWKLLSSSGQLINARKLAAQYWPQVIQHRFIRLQPVVQLAKAYLDLGLADRSWEVFQLVEPTFGDNPRYWMEFGDLLIEAQQWQDVISHAVKLRTQRGGIADTKVYAFFIEGLALGKQKMTMPATTAFKRLIEESPLKNATMVTRMAQGMVEVGHGDLALEFLALHDAMIEDRPVFFDLMFQAAKLAGNPAALSAAMKSLEETSAPAPVTAKRRLEKAVLMLDDTEQPLGTFLQVRSASDWSDSERLLVASARWLQGDVSGLEAQLNSIESESLASHEKALMTLIQFDRLIQLGRLEEARSLLILMEEDRLFPGYEAKLESLKIQLNTSPQESP